MSRRFVNLIVGHYPASTLHRINPWRCFYPTTQQALAAAENSKGFTVEDARLPRAAISFYEPLQEETPDDGEMHYASLGSSSNGIISIRPDGNTFLYDGASRSLRVMPAPHSPKYSSVFLTVGDGLYILERNPGTEEDHSFEALLHRAPSDGICFTDEKWYWRSLPPPPYAYDGYECEKVGDYEEYRRRCYERNGRDPYVIRAYTVVRDSQIWISTRDGGTFSFDTTSGVWSEAGDWALPFYDRVEYAPELGLWFGFTSEGRQLAACDLGAASPTSPPVLRKVWDELAQPLPPRWASLMAFLLPLGGGKFCVARMFHLAQKGWFRGSIHDYLEEDTFVVLTGVEVVRGSRGALRMIKHKSRRYSVGCTTADLL
ncbi:hypothetical protein C2845_PM11G23540 [Panicum miliaceum]|uniref:Uncharacterized protein n=1 Tax=Panicum miliaceum TaxID=4540 RepID=A0A3L6RWP0_PANMI|nr:hypothetical protein C2845_PM11G23540 [Panicum miliaceum]